jgi:uncharacterized protein YdeI (YjbR/CyaY-like superfamily)
VANSNVLKPSFFKTPAEFRKWLERNHDSAEELILGLHKIDENSWAIRLTPRRPGSIWSAVNTKRAHALIAEGRMTTAGLAEFEKRNDKRSKRYSYERENPKFDAASEAAFRSNEKAWEFFRAQPTGYQRLHTWWVISAKRQDTRAKRLAVLIEISARGRRIDPMKSPFGQVTGRTTPKTQTHEA